MREKPVNLVSFAVMRRETGNDPSFVAQLVAAYLASTPRLAAHMREAMGAGRTEVLAHLAHELKSTSSMLGVDGVASLCGEIEREARRGRLEVIADCLNRVDAEAPRVETALRNLVRSADARRSE